MMKNDKPSTSPAAPKAAVGARNTRPRKLDQDTPDSGGGRGQKTDRPGFDLGGSTGDTHAGTVVVASALAVFFDLGRIASLGAFFYLIMDMIIQWGVDRYRRKEIGAAGTVLLVTIGFDIVVLAAFTAIKLRGDPAVVLYAAIAICAVFGVERYYLGGWTGTGGTGRAGHGGGSA